MPPAAGRSPALRVGRRFEPALRRIAASLLLLSALGARPARATLDDPASRVRTTTLANGMTVLTLVDSTTPVVSLQIWVKAGSRDETRYTGIAHLFEHMMFKGSTNLPPERHAQLLEARGGRVNAFTTNDVTAYFEDLPPDALPLALALEAERFANLDISEKTLASERQVVLEERRLRTEDDPQGRLLEQLFATTFIAHPYRWPVIGWRSDVEAVGVPQCRAFFDTYYAPNDLVMVIVGSFDEADALRRVQESFGKMKPAAEIPRNPTQEPAQRGERRAVVHFDVRAPVVAAAWHAPKAGDPDAPALEVLGEILSSGRSSRLYERLVYREQLALAAAGGYWDLASAGLFYAYVAVRPGVSPDAAERSLLAEVERLRREEVGADELAKAKKQIEVGIVSGLTTTHGLASRFAGETILYGRIRPLEERLAELEAVTAADVERVAKTHLAPEGRNVVRLQREGDASAGAAPPRGRKAP
ncbi:MAG TPA: pitrilysin family protein [Myxococcota bacterium]|nr:pitrilysin family protein [Myxococcota bacterium]